ncbi:hypothetical protein ACOME3_001804 [Neoechinorhynchus agilis]
MGFTLLLLVAAIVIELPSSQYDSIGTVNGTITANNHFPKGAIVKVRLDQISQRGNNVKPLARELIFYPPRFPVKFNLRYDREMIDFKNVYAINVRVEDPRRNNRLLFLNYVQVPVSVSGTFDKDIEVPLVKSNSMMAALILIQSVLIPIGSHPTPSPLPSVPDFFATMSVEQFIEEMSVDINRNDLNSEIAEMIVKYYPQLGETHILGCHDHNEACAGLQQKNYCANNFIKTFCPKMCDIC